MNDINQPVEGTIRKIVKNNKTEIALVLSVLSFMIIYLSTFLIFKRFMEMFSITCMMNLAVSIIIFCYIEYEVKLQWTI